MQSTQVEPKSLMSSPEIGSAKRRRTHQIERREAGGWTVRMDGRGVDGQNGGQAQKKTVPLLSPARLGRLVTPLLRCYNPAYKGL